MPEFSQELFDEICDELSEGKSLRNICQREDMPNKSAVFKWLNKSPELVDQYARARETQADVIFDECLAIADQYDASEKLEGDTDHIQRAKLRIDTRKWMAGKLRPKVYGEKVTQELVGAGGGPLVTEVQYVIVDPLDEDSAESGEVGDTTH